MLLPSLLVTGLCSFLRVMLEDSHKFGLNQHKSVANQYHQQLKLPVSSLDCFSWSFEFTVWVSAAVTSCRTRSHGAFTPLRVPV